MINVLSGFAVTACKGGSFLGFPAWYKYIDSTKDAAGGCVPKINSLTDLWLILAAVIEILLRIAAIAAVVFVLLGGIEYIMSQGEPDKTKKAQSTIINALIGLVVSIAAITVVSFVAGKF